MAYAAIRCKVLRWTTTLTERSDGRDVVTLRHYHMSAPESLMFWYKRMIVALHRTPTFAGEGRILNRLDGSSVQHIRSTSANETWQSRTQAQHMKHMSNTKTATTML
jgi:hypothetical protein